MDAHISMAIPSRPLAGRVDRMSEANAGGVGGTILAPSQRKSPHPARFARHPPRQRAGGKKVSALINRCVLPLAPFRGRDKKCQPTLGSSLVDHSAVSFQSLRVTVITSVPPSIATWPKNCMSALGGKFWPCSLVGALMYMSCGPNVLSSSLGPNVPAWIGPETNSQNGSKSWNTALLGS